MLVLLLHGLIYSPWASAQGTGGGASIPIGTFNPNATGGTPVVDAQFLLLSPNAILSDYRIATGGTNINIADGGAKGNATISLTGQVALTNGGTGAATRQGAIDNLLDAAGGSAGDIFYNDGANIVPLPVGANGEVLTLTGGLPVWATTSLGAPSTAQYVTLATDATLTNERVLTGTTNRITLDDKGAGGAIILDIGTDVVTLTGAQVLTNKELTSPAITAGSSIVLKGSSFDSTISWTDPAAARALTIPDPGGAASFVMTAGAQTIGGVKTFSSSPVLSTNAITSGTAKTISLPDATDTLVNLNSSQVLTNKELTSAQLSTDFRLKTGAFKYTFNWDALAADRTITVKDVGTDARMVLGSTSFAYSAGAIPYGNGNTLSMASAGTSSQALLGGSSPAFGTLPAAGGGTGVTTVPPKGSLLVGNSGGTAYVNLAVGSDGTVLTADSTQTNGVRWVSPGAINLTGSTGIVCQTGSNTYSARTITDAGTGLGQGITITNPGGVAGNITLRTTDHQVQRFQRTFTPAEIKASASGISLMSTSAGTYQIIPIAWCMRREVGTVVYSTSGTFHLTYDPTNANTDITPDIAGTILTTANAAISTQHMAGIVFDTAINNTSSAATIYLEATANPTGASADCDVHVVVYFIEVPVPQTP